MDNNLSNYTISVAMTSFNSERYIKEQIDSIISQLSENDELIISDDGSTDSTFEIIEAYHDNRIKLIHNNPNSHGVDKNFENALRNCANEIIMFSDDDNVWMPNKVETVLKIFKSKDYDFIMHNCIITDDKLNVINDSFFKWRKAKVGILRNIIRTSYGGSLMVFKRKCLEKMLPFPEKMPYYFDEFVGMIATKYYKVLFLDEKLSYWRRHEGSQSSGFSTDVKQNFLKRNWFRVKSKIKKIKFAIKY